MKIARTLVAMWVGYKLCEHSRLWHRAIDMTLTDINRNTGGKVDVIFGIEEPEPKVKEPIGFKVG